MNSFVNIAASIGILLCLAGAWTCHRAGRGAPHARALPWHGLSLLLLLRAVSATLWMFAAWWEPFGVVFNSLWLGGFALVAALLARTFIPDPSPKGGDSGIQISTGRVQSRFE